MVAASNAYSEGGCEKKEEEEEKGDEVKGGVEEGVVKEEMFPTRLRSWTDRKKGDKGSGDWKSIKLPPGPPPPPVEPLGPPATVLLPALVAPLPPGIPRPPAPRPRPKEEVVGELAEETAREVASQLGLRPSVGAFESQLARRRSALYEGTEPGGPVAYSELLE